VGRERDAYSSKSKVTQDPKRMRKIMKEEVKKEEKTKEDKGGKKKKENASLKGILPTDLADRDTSFLKCRIPTSKIRLWFFLHFITSNLI
jgi:hypothetical protein